MSWKNGIGSGRLWTALLGAALVAAFAALPSAAQEHFDVLLYEDPSGNLASGGLDLDTGEAEPDLDVIEGELFGNVTPGVPPTFFMSTGVAPVGDEPGYASYGDAAISSGPPVGFPAGADNLPGSAGVEIDFLVEPVTNRSLSYWNDIVGDWEPIALGTTLTIDNASSTGGSLDGVSEIIGLELADTDPDGSLDSHPDYSLSDGSPVGVYLAYGQARVDGFSDPSDPFWIVFGTLDDCELPTTAACTLEQEEFNEAIEGQIETALEFTEANLVPEPGTALLLSLGLLGLGVAGTRGRRA